MPTNQELQQQVDHLTALLVARDEKEAAAKAAALQAQQQAENAADLAARAAARAAEVETIRKGVWVGHLLGQVAKGESVDLASLDSKIPAEGWPPGHDPRMYNIGVGAVVKTIDVSNTLLGKLRRKDHGQR